MDLPSLIEITHKSFQGNQQLVKNHCFGKIWELGILEFGFEFY